MKRRLAREIIVQSLYQMEMNEVDSAEAVEMLIAEASEENESEHVITDETELKAYVVQHVNGVWEHKVAIDDMLEHYLKGWQMSRLSRVDRQILRLATFEMVFADDVPAKVAVNEAIDLAKHFGTEDSGKFVNGVLGKMIQEIDKLKSEL
ncbi:MULTISPECIES: transcription antitermination factor NusB [unclassified Paenibacillus]|uniref:transcription antitermination factor NusB n=1 Tax=unclassified Paenibacillus TaxID=185978 RepID=UPI00076D31B2|nr:MULTISPECIES: transcription antitermination factor NusB [unclassified Paenibacillus]KUP21408.1 N utilization substance protein B [Paenibacillus sp. DMB5]MDF9840481.1 N utilization substance protein B [Paenibacillus sp. PastF-2]MDF9847063.1 N utilization substance protein B [Paenibacillus sp. PastM-2]MDF9853635.1 N utilization substance protein B [Paenibacillus sp. PastF-1]MDH6478879.1 N utilization substance protein B [Paenibacillus sp. PastH-2]